MKWTSVNDGIPKCEYGEFIVAIMGSRHQFSGDPIEFAEIKILRAENGEWLSMDCCQRFYVKKQYDLGQWYNTIAYWMDWKDFEFPKEMIK